MHLRLSTILYCAIIAGIATVSYGASDPDDTLSEQIDIDALVEGSGVDPGFGPDSEASGSGAGEDDEDAPRSNLNNKHKVIFATPSTHKPEDPIVPKVIEHVNKGNDLDFDQTDHHGNRHDSDRVAVSSEEGHISFFAQPGILAAIIGGALVGLLCAILVVMFIVYRMRKKDEGSYALDERKRSSTPILYGKGDGKELYA